MFIAPAWPSISLFASLGLSQSRQYILSHAISRGHCILEYLSWKPASFTCWPCVLTHGSILSTPAPFSITWGVTDSVYLRDCYEAKCVCTYTYYDARWNKSHLSYDQLRLLYWFIGCFTFHKCFNISPSIRVLWCGRGIHILFSRT